MLQIKTIPVGPLGANCNFVWDDASLEGYIIDPGGDGEKIIKEAQALKLYIRAVLLTHGHDDHCAAAGEVKKALSAPLWMHELDAPMLSDAKKRAAFFGGGVVCEPPERLLHEGELLPFGELSLRVIEVPGHTLGGLAFYIDGAVFTGDSLFYEEIGRCDLYGGSLNTLLKNLREKLLTLLEGTEVFPGHGPNTTILHEKQRNPYVGGSLC